MVSTSTRLTPGGSGRETFAAISVTSAPRRAAAAASAIPIRPLERLPMKRTASIGSRVPPAVTRTRRPAQGPGSPADRSPDRRPASAGLVPQTARRPSPPPRHGLDPASSTSGSGRRPRPCSPREASRPSSGSITSTPRSRSAARLAWVAASAYMRSFIAGATRRGAVQARKDVASIESAKPPASLAIVLAEAGRDEEGVAVGGQLEVADRVVALLPGSPGKAPRIGSRSNSEVRTGAPTIPSNEAAPTKRSAFVGHHDPDAMPGQRREARELERLVGRYPSADTQQQPGHLRAPDERGATRLAAVLVFELALGQLFECHREVVALGVGLHHRGRVLAEATLTEVVEVAVDLTRPLRRTTTAA